MEKRHSKKRPPGSILDHFGELFGNHFGVKNDQRTTAGQFFKKNRASPYCKNYMFFKNLGGPTEKKTTLDQLLGLKSGQKNRSKTKASKSEVLGWFRADFGSHFGTFLVQKKTIKKLGGTKIEKDTILDRFWAPFWLHFGTKKPSENQSKKRA